MFNDSLRSLLAVLVLVSETGVAWGAEPKDDVQAAVKKMEDGGNYSWVWITNNTDDVAGATGGAKDKDTTTYSVAQFQASSPAVEQGGKLVVKIDDGTWKTVDEVAKLAADARIAVAAAREAAATQSFVAEEMPRWELLLNNSLQNLYVPTVELKEMADRLKDVTKAQGVYTADLIPEVAANLLMNRRPGATAPASAPATAPASARASATTSAPATAPRRFRRPEPTGAKGTVKFTLKDGVVVKYEVRVSGTFVFGDQERATERSYSMEFSVFGTTKVTVPPEAKAKLAAMAATGPVRP